MYHLDVGNDRAIVLYEENIKSDQLIIRTQLCRY